MYSRRITMVAASIAAAVLLAHGAATTPMYGADMEVFNSLTPWRVYLVTAPPVEGADGKFRKHPHDKNRRNSPLPPTTWRELDFDDGTWGRYQNELAEMLGGYGYRQSLWSALLCMRSRFGVSDPGRAGGLKLAVTFRGGAVVYVNGKEVGRAHMPKGKVEPLTLADDYGLDAYTLADGRTRLPVMRDRPAEQFLERYEKRVRWLNVAVPRNVLRRGANVVAVELHRSAVRRHDWSTLGFYSIRMTGKGDGVVPPARAARMLSIWNATPLETISGTSDGKLPFRADTTVGGPGLAVAGLKMGDPFEPLRPVRMAATRNGVCSGQIVLSNADGLRDVAAKVSTLTNLAGAALPAGAIQVRYAIQQEGAPYCDALMDKPAKGAVVQPVWVIVTVPRHQAAGWYTGTLTAEANARRFAVPLHVLVSGWALPDARNFASYTSLLQSPDTVAIKYNVTPWSHKHFALLDKSLALMGQVGNDMALVPVVLHTHMGHRTGMIRWVKTAADYKPDFSAMERYLDLYARHCGPPKVLCLGIWKPTLGSKALFRGVRMSKREPLLVTQVDPATGKMSELEAPLFGRPGSEAFWKPMFDGVRRIVRNRGWSQRCVMLGQGFDSRPLPDVLDALKKLAPGARWVIYSHWVRDPGPKDGKLVVSGSMEVGCQETVNIEYLPQLHPGSPDLGFRELGIQASGGRYVPQSDYFRAGSFRWHVIRWSSPPAYANVAAATGAFCRIGLDFWPVTAGSRGGRSIMNTRLCGPWVYKNNPRSIVAAGPRWAVATVRFQTLRQAVQQAEARIFIAGKLAKLDGKAKQRYRKLLAQRLAFMQVGAILPQAQISLDWQGLAAREYAAAAELVGAKVEATWDAPPQAHPATRD